MTKVIKLDSMLEAGKGTAEHMLVDVTPGHGKFEGKAVLTLHFGTLFLSGLLAEVRRDGESAFRGWRDPAEPVEKFWMEN